MAMKLAPAKLNQASRDVLSASPGPEKRSITSCVQRLSMQTNDLADLAALATTLSDRILGPVGVECAKGLGSEPSCILGEIEDVAESFSLHISKLRDALYRIENGLS